MTGAIISIVIIIWAAAVNAVRMGDRYPLPYVLPFCNGGPVGIWDFAGCAVLLAFAVAFLRIGMLATEPRDGEHRDGEHRVRRRLWLIPLSLFFAHYIRKNVEPSVSWCMILDQFHIQDPQRFSQWFVLAVTCGAILAIEYAAIRR
jgi:hypothetical protein